MLKGLLSPAALALSVALWPFSAGAFEVQLSVSMKGGANPQFYGTTNLPDGMQVQFTVTRPGWYAGQQFVSVQDGRYSTAPFSNHGRQLPSGPIEVEITTPSAMVLSPEVRKVIGERGERLEGPLIGHGPLPESMVGRMVYIKEIVEIP